MWEYDHSDHIYVYNAKKVKWNKLINLTVPYQIVSSFFILIN